MPTSVYDVVARRGIDIPSKTNLYNFHHALLSKGDMMGAPDSEKKKIHDPRNILVIPESDNASHANVPTRKDALKMLLKHYSLSEIRSWWDSVELKTKPAFPTLE